MSSGFRRGAVPEGSGRLLLRFTPSADMSDGQPERDKGWEESVRPIDTTKTRRTLSGRWSEDKLVPIALLDKKRSVIEGR